ncbi:MAG: Gfo/Idh/MocA family oxidoreductase, partial [bacterium]
MRQTRRAFLVAAGLFSGATGAGGCRSFFRSGGTRRKSVGERLNIGVIGVGGCGQANWSAAYEAGENIAAMCDVDETALLMGREKVATACPSVRLYKDFRVMFDAEKGLDAVVSSTPDHGHGMQAAWAMGHGCHVYVEPPLARTLREVRFLEEKARACGVVTQLGDQGSAAPAFRRAVEVLATGLIGKVSEVHVWTGCPVWPQGVNRPDGSDRVPTTLDWDLWLGGAPVRPYKSKAYHRFNWRGWHDFGTGALGDVGCHLMNLPFRALGLAAPVSVEALDCTERFVETYPKASKVCFDFAARGKHRPPVKLWWYDGNWKPASERMPQVVAAFRQVPSTGCLLVGERGVWLAADDTGTRHYLALQGEERVTDSEKHEACKAVPETLPRVQGQQRDVFDAIRNGKRPCSDLAHAAPLTESVVAGWVAQRVPGKG